MDKLEKVIKGLELCATFNACRASIDCPYKQEGSSFPVCYDRLAMDALEVLKKQKEIIDTYHKADTFLAVHGWQWKETTTESSTNPKNGEQE